MAGIKWIDYKGQKILFCDYQHVQGDQVIPLFKKANALVLESAKKVLVLSDFTNTPVEADAVKYLKNAESRRAAGNMERSAVIGIAGVKKVLMNFYNMATNSNAKAFNDLAKALEWLICSD